MKPSSLLSQPYAHPSGFKVWLGKVWKVEEKKSGQVYALKVMDKAKIITKKSVKAVLQDRRILSRLMDAGAEFVGGMHGSFQDKNHLYLLLDFLEGKSLRHHLNCGITLSETQIRTLPITQSGWCPRC